MKRLLLTFICLFLHTICFADVTFTMNELIFSDLPYNGMDTHSFYDGWYIWYANANTDMLPSPTNSDHGSPGNNLVRYDPFDDSHIVYPLAIRYDIPQNNQPIAYQALDDPANNVIYVYGPYGISTLWKFDKSDYSSIAYPLEDSGVAGLGGGKICKWETKNEIWMTVCYSGFGKFDIDTGNITPLTFKADVLRLEGQLFSSYGIKTNEKNMFVMRGAGTNYNILVSIPDDYIPDDTTPIVNIRGIDYTCISTSGGGDGNGVVHIDISPYSAADIEWDGTYLWLQAMNASTTQVYILQYQPEFNKNGYTTAFTLINTISMNRIFDGSLGPTIKSNAKWVVAGWETNVTTGISIIDKVNLATHDLHNLPFTYKWVSASVMLTPDDTFYVSGYVYGKAPKPDYAMRVMKIKLYESTTTIQVTTSTTTAPGTTTIVVDSDDDGVPDSQDNCPQKPNGPSIGACTPSSDKPGITCESDANCVIGCSINGKCSMNQEDTDADGSGDVCDIDEQIRALVRKYYLDILGREPDTDGWDYWTNEIKHIVSLGIYVGEGFHAQSRFFFNSSEYLSKSTSDKVFVTDLYHTFLQREPDAAGLAYWVGELSCLTRNMLITQFAYSPEFQQLMTDTFGADTTRPENNLINDLYRGFLNRFPDDGGFNGYLSQMRTAQCTGAEAVRNLSYQITLSFMQSAEYIGRSRDNSGYVEDLYNGILRRGGDCPGFTTWVNDLDGGASRANVLKSFTDSTEYQTRVNAVIAAGCILP